MTMFTNPQRVVTEEAKELRKAARKAARKAERKAARLAQMEAEKKARTAERKAARQAERDAKKAEKQAARDARKAARKAERAADKAKIEIAEALDVRQNTMSANLSVLHQAGLVRNERQGRSIRYFADLDGTSALLSFLIEDCCGGRPEDCQPLIARLACAS